MDKKVLIVGDSNGFMVGSIKKRLEKEKFQVDIHDSAITAFENSPYDPQIILFYMDDEPDRELVIALGDKVVNGTTDSFLYLIGDDIDFKAVEKIIPEHNIAGRFNRPLNVNELANAMITLVGSKGDDSDKKQILIVDDDPTTLRTIRSVLQEKYKVYMVNSGMNAITFLANHNIDLILLDYQMPIVDGPDVLRMLHSEDATKDIPVMFLTSKSDRSSVERVIWLKPEGYLLKTMPPKDLMNEIDKFFVNANR